MSPRNRVHLAGLSALVLTATLAFGLAPPPAKPAASPAKPIVMPYRVSEPVAHENLTIFFLFGEDQIKGKKILTLDEALKDKKVIVHETKNVNELAIENVSKEEVFVQAGDIVKGGQQDRTIAIDAIIQPKSGRVPLNSFCVEQGRWSQRGGEDVRSFSFNDYTIVGNSLKIAARGAKSQGGVWREVTMAQDKLQKVLKAEVKDARSASSLQLTLEHKKVQEALDGYVKKFEKSLPSEKTGNVIGFAVAINGKVMSADVYANRDLFQRLWPKLLRSTVIEALAEKNDKIKPTSVKADAVSIFLANAVSGKRSERTVLRDLEEVQLESAENVFFETKKAGKDGVILRRSYIAK